PDGTSVHLALPALSAAAAAGSPMSGRPTTAPPARRLPTTAGVANWPFYPRGAFSELFGDFDGHGALRGLLRAQYPDQSADRADDEGYRAVQQRDVDA